MNTQCIVCQKNIDSPSDLVCCCLCDSNYHLGCAEIVESSRRSARNTQFKCKKCIQHPKNKPKQTTKNDILLSDEQPSSVKQGKQMSQSPKSAPAQPKGTDSLSDTTTDGANHGLLTSELFVKELSIFKTAIMEFVEKKLDSYTQKYESIILENQEIIKSIQFLSEQHDELKQRIIGIEKSQKTVHTDMMEINKHNSVLQNTISLQEEKIDRLEYITQICNIDIRGIPESNTENNIETLKKISNIINYGTTALPLQSEITKIYRLGPKLSEKNPRSIVVSFNNIKSRDDFLNKVKAYKKSTTTSTNKLNTADLGLSQEAKRIYVSEHLTRKGKFLLSQTKKFAKDNDYKHSWSSSGRILLRQTDTSKIITIKNVLDLDRQKCQSL